MNWGSIRKIIPIKSGWKKWCSEIFYHNGKLIGNEENRLIEPYLIVKSVKSEQIHFTEISAEVQKILTNS